MLIITKSSSIYNLREGENSVTAAREPHNQRRLYRVIFSKMHFKISIHVQLVTSPHHNTLPDLNCNQRFYFDPPSSTREDMVPTTTPTIQQPLIYSEDMSDEMRSKAIEISQAAFQMTVAKGHVFSSIAAKIRDEFDKYYDGIGWNCVVGKAFGSSVTHEIKTYMYVFKHFFDEISIALVLDCHIIWTFISTLHSTLFLSPSLVQHRYFSVIPGTFVLLWRA